MKERKRSVVVTFAVTALSTFAFRRRQPVREDKLFAFRALLWPVREKKPGSAAGH